MGRWLKEGGVNGQTGPMVCPHINPSRATTRTFDQIITPEAPVVGAQLSRFGV